MTNSATSLDRLHDLALPPDARWWPLAPGWYVVALVVLVLVLLLVHRAWKSYLSNAYRRAALRELAAAPDAAAIAELLRRTALAIAPRQAIAEKTGDAWLDWLAEQSSTPLPRTIRSQLTAGIYGRPTESSDLTALRVFTAGWITQHHTPVTKP